MTNSERLQEIKDRFAKLGWLNREDILWLLQVLGETIQDLGDACGGLRLRKKPYQPRA
jgi:hypothetical protein